MSNQNNSSFTQQSEVHCECASEQPSIHYKEKHTPTSYQNPLATIDSDQLQYFVNLFWAQDIV